MNLGSAGILSALSGMLRGSFGARVSQEERRQNADGRGQNALAPQAG
jgi:hypothetical protein